MKHFKFNRTATCIISIIINAIAFAWNLYLLFQPNITSKTLLILCCILSLVAIILIVRINIYKENKTNK